MGPHLSNTSGVSVGCHRDCVVYPDFLNYIPRTQDPCPQQNPPKKIHPGRMDAPSTPCPQLDANSSTFSGAPCARRCWSVASARRNAPRRRHAPRPERGPETDPGGTSSTRTPEGRDQWNPSAEDGRLERRTIVLVGWFSCLLFPQGRDLQGVKIQSTDCKTSQTLRDGGPWV